MPDPQDGFFQLHEPGEKASQVLAGEELVITTRVSFDELAARVQILERVIAGAPLLGLIYSTELKKAGLERRDLITRTVVPTR